MPRSRRLASAGFSCLPVVRHHTRRGSSSLLWERRDVLDFDANSLFDEGQREQPRVIKLRLRRMGAKKRPSYRIVAADSRAPRDGRFIEIIGTYDPLTDPSTVKINEERAKHWLSN